MVLDPTTQNLWIIFSKGSASFEEEVEKQKVLSLPQLKHVLIIMIQRYGVVVLISYGLIWQMLANKKTYTFNIKRCPI